MNSLPVIGMGPGNSYFKEDKISFVLENSLKENEKIAIMIADIPAIATYLALGYPENRARTDKAVRNGNNLKNRVKKIIEDEKIDPARIIIVDWENEVEKSSSYVLSYGRVRALYESNSRFRDDCSTTTESVLRFSRKEIKDMHTAISIAVHYLLSEIAFLECGPEFFGADSTEYTYHNNWPVYERYISGVYDGKDRRSYMRFKLLEHPSEKVVDLVDDVDSDSNENALERIKRTGLLFAGYAEYEKAFYFDKGIKKGVFHDLLVEIAAINGWQIVWTQEVGYGAIVDSLNSKKFDVFASTAWSTPEREKAALFSKSLYSSPVFSWCREDWEKSEKLRIAVKENDISHSLSKKYPQVELVFVEQLSNTKELLQVVVDGRADITFVEESLAIRFNELGQNRVVKYKSETEEVFNNSFMLRNGEEELISVINRNIEEMIDNGFIHSLLIKYHIK